MAALTWRNVDAPNFGDANDLFKSSAALLQNSVDNARRGLNDFRSITTDEQSAKLMADVIAAGNDPAAIARITQSANPNYLNPDALKFVNNQPGIFLDRQGKALDNTGAGLQNNIRSQSIKANDFNFGRTQLEAQRADQDYNMMPEALSQMGTIRADLASGDPARMVSAEKKQAEFVGKYGRTLGINNSDDLNQFMSGNIATQNAGMELNNNRLSYVTGLENAARNKDAKGITNNVLGITNNDPAAALRVVQGMKDLDYETQAATIQQLTKFQESMPAKSPAIAAIEAAQTSRGLPVANTQKGINNADVPARSFNSPASAPLAALIDKTEGGGKYNTLYGNAQNKGNLAGVDVSKMTLGDLYDFSSGSGAYGRQQKNNLGYLATPMGRHQIVGSTLKATAKSMGLPDDVVFTPQVQDAMFEHIAKEAISGPRTMSGKIDALRGQWEGFKNVPNNQLALAITAFEGGDTGALNNIDGLERGTVGQADTNQIPGINAQSNPINNPIRMDIADPDQLVSENDQFIRQTTDSFLADVGSGSSGKSSTVQPTNPSNDIGGPQLSPKVAEILQSRAPVESNISIPNAQQTAGTTAAFNDKLTSDLLSNVLPENTTVNVTKVDPKQTAFMQDVDRLKRSGDISGAVEKIKVRLATGGIGNDNIQGGAPLASITGSIWDYFTADPEQANANSEARGKSSSALKFFQSDTAKAYFDKNPDELSAAATDPIKFAEDYKAKFPNKVLGKSETVDPKNTVVASDETPTNYTIRKVTDAESVSQAFSTALNTSAINNVNRDNASIDEAIQTSAGKNETVAQAANRLTNKESGTLSAYENKYVTPAIQQIMSETGIKSPTIAGAILEQVGTYNDGFLGFGEGFDLNIEKAKSIWSNYQTGEGTNSANSGVASLNASDATKLQETNLNALKTQYAETEAALKAAIADPNTTKSEKLLLEQELKNQLKYAKEQITNILSSGSLDNNLRANTGK